MKVIDRAEHRGTKYSELLVLYGLDALERRSRKHHLSVMFRHSLDASNLVRVQPEIELRSNQKIKFKHKITQLTKVQKIPIIGELPCGTDFGKESRKQPPR